MNNENPKLPAMPNPFGLDSDGIEKVGHLLNQMTDAADGNTLGEILTACMGAMLATFSCTYYEDESSKTDIIGAIRKMGSNMEEFVNKLQ